MLTVVGDFCALGHLTQVPPVRAEGDTVPGRDLGVTTVGLRPAVRGHLSLHPVRYQVMCRRLVCHCHESQTRTSFILSESQEKKSKNPLGNLPSTVTDCRNG